MDFLSGALAGMAGLLPFLHTNLILGFIQNATPAFVVALAFSHTVFELFPMVFFGIPGAEQGIGALPAQRMAQKGEGFKALYLGASGLAAGLMCAAVLTPVVLMTWPVLLPLLKPYTGFLLVAVVLLAWIQDKAGSAAVLVFLGSGLLGTTVFRLPLEEPLFPLLTGLFGIPALLVAGKGLTPQEEKASPWKMIHAMLAAILGAFSVLLPALSPSFLSALALFAVRASSENLLFLSTAIVSSKLYFDFLAAAVLHKARSAPAAVFLENHVGLDDALPLLALAVILFTVMLGIAWRLRKRIPDVFHVRFPPFGIVALVAAGAYLTGGATGLFALAWASFFSAACLDVAPRKYLLGALMVPAMLHAFGLPF